MALDKRTGKHREPKKEIDWDKIPESIELIDNKPEANNLWIIENRLYGTGIYQPIIQKINEKDTD